MLSGKANKMNFQNYFPASYQQMVPQQMQQPQMIMQPTQVQPQPQPQQHDNGIHWVMGEAAAQAEFVSPGQSKMFMDSNASTFYIKTVDQSGMPLPLRIFDYTERKQQPHSEPQIQQTVDTPDYITRDEFEQRLAEIESAKKETTNNVKKEKQS